MFIEKWHIDDAAASLNSNCFARTSKNKGCCYLKKHANVINTDKQSFSKVLDHGKLKKKQKCIFLCGDD
jgi:hypothetical protein